MWHCVAACCGVLWCVVVCCGVPVPCENAVCYGAFWCIAVCCIVLRCASPLCQCSVFQCVSVWCSVVQCAIPLLNAPKLSAQIRDRIVLSVFMSGSRSWAFIACFAETDLVRGRCILNAPVPCASAPIQLNHPKK